MGAFLSPARESFRILPGLTLLNRGKVRDTYALADDQHLLIVTSDGISIFDYVLNVTVPTKGYVLNMMSVFWLQMMEQRGFPTHLITAGKGIDDYLPDDLKNDADLQARAMVVKKAVTDPGEFIYRNVLTGSSVGPYQASGKVCGIPLPKGLQDGDKFDRPLFTPTTKAEVGHDEHVDAADFFADFPSQSFMGYQIFLIAARYAESRGILIADTKFEFGRDSDVQVMLIDEVLSPDSSRFWSLAAWQEMQKLPKRTSPPSFDKQPVRDYGAQLGINDKNRSPKNPADRAWVWSLEFPQKLIDHTTVLDRYIFWRITGFTVEDYAKKLGVILPRQRKNIVILFGSDSDLTKPIYQAIRTARVRYMPSGELSSLRLVTNFSYHGRPDALWSFAETGEFTVLGSEGGNKILLLDEIDYFIYAAGIAAAQAGIFDAFLAHHNHHIPVIGLALGPEGTENLLAAQLSIKCLPGGHVVTDEINGSVYTNAFGLEAAIERIANGELPPPKKRTTKPIEIDPKID
ncbi:MAG: phosphoribosylaminoimidazolesuccinocarboxamide synthase [Patescibacteria group bacterium]